MFTRYEYDVIVVLGGGIDLEGKLKEPSKCRINLAVDLYHQKLAPKIVVSSQYSMHLKSIPQKTIAEAMKDELVAKKIPSEHIEMENISRDTLGNAYYTKIKHLIPRGCKNIAIVTSHFHRERSEYLFRKILGDEYSIAFFEAKDGLFGKDLELQQRLEKQQLAAHKKDLEQYRDGDHIAMNPENWHPAYSKKPKYTFEEYFERTQSNQLSPFHEEFKPDRFIKSNL